MALDLGMYYVYPICAGPGGPCERRAQPQRGIGTMEWMARNFHAAGLDAGPDALECGR